MATHDFSHVHLLGDFNLPCIDWSTLQHPKNGPSLTLFNMASMFGLSQVNHVQNHRGVLLDLIFSTTQDANIKRDIDVLLPEDVHHPPLSMTLTLPVKKSYKVVYQPNLRRCNLEKVFAELKSIDLLSLTANNDVNESFKIFCRTISESVIRNSPLKRHGPSPFPVWFSNELKQLIIQKKNLHRLYKSSFDPLIYNKFSTIRSECKKLSQECFDRYIDHIQSTLPVNPKVFWSFIKDMNRVDPSPSTMTLDGRSSTDDQSTANMFADYFSSVFADNHNNPHNPISPTVTNSLPSCFIDSKEVSWALKHLDVTKGPGPDSIPPAVIKHCSDLFVQPFTILINKSLSTGIFPEIFKISHIIPILKKGPVEDIKNYRPIAILSAFAKVFEKLVLNKIKFNINNLITNNQHGFMTGRSSSTNLVVFQTHIIEALSERLQVDAIELDFSKAFDRVCHSLLIYKLDNCGFSGTILQWLSSYLYNRKLQVRYHSALSKEFIASSGVPQGSHLGPILFNLYINDVVSNLHCNHLLFADDLKLYTKISSTQDTLTLQNDLKLVEDWCRRNSMSLNLEKCICITFHRKSSPVMFPYTISGEMVRRASEVKDLGVTFTQTLNWDVHIHNTCNKAARNLGLIFRFSKTFTDYHPLRLLYCSLVRPHLEFCSVVWSPHQNYLKEEIERVQRRFIRLVGMRFGYKYLDVPIDEIAALMHLPSLKSRRLVQDTLFLFRLVNSELDCPELLGNINFRVPVGTRSKALFAKTTVPTNYSANSTLIRIQQQGNSLPDCLDFFNSAYASFKKKLQQKLY